MNMIVLPANGRIRFLAVLSLTGALLYLGSGFMISSRVGDGPHKNKQNPSSDDVDSKAAKIDFSNDIDSVLLDLDESATPADWVLKHTTPGDVFRKALDLKRVNPEAFRDLCKDLLQLDVLDLAHFEVAIRGEADSGSYSNLLPCFNDLRVKLEDHWQRARSHAPPSPLPDSGKIKTGFVSKLADLKPKQVILTFEDHTKQDGLFSEIVAAIDTLLRKHPVKAHLFARGTRSAFMAERAAQSQEQTFVPGLSGLKHIPIVSMSAREGERELEDARLRFVKAFKLRESSPVFFRFPYSMSSEFYDEFAHKKNLVLLDYTHDSEDWKHTDPKFIADTLAQKLSSEPMGVIRFSIGPTATLIALPHVLAWLSSNNFEVVTLDLR